MAPLTPAAFIVPRDDYHMLWVSSPNGTFMLLEGAWQSVKVARSFLERAGYAVISPEVGLDLVERQMTLERKVSTKH